jgi:hypothetical protein
VVALACVLSLHRLLLLLWQRALQLP